MPSFERWLRVLLLMLGFSLSTLGCQVVFGDFEVGHRADSGQGGLGGMNENASSGSPGAAGSNGPQVSGPLVVTPTSDLFTSDRGAEAKFYVALAHKPKNPVTIPIASNNIKEGTVSPSNLAFTTDDWNAPQAVTVTGVWDKQAGDQLYTVQVGPASSEDGDFSGAQAIVSITNIDNDGAGFFVTPKQGLRTTEAGGYAMFTVVLNSDPADDVTISLSSSDPTIGTVAPSSLTFTRDNWNEPRTVQVTGHNDDIAGEDRPYVIQVGPLTSRDESYAKLPSQNVSVTNLDNDKPGVTVALTSGVDLSDTTRLRTSESGGLAAFSVALNREPAKPVTIGVESSSTAEGTVSPSSLIFTPLNWAAPQTVTIRGVDDSAADGDQPYQVKFASIMSEDPAYNNLSPADLPPVNVINSDDDKAAITLTLLTGVDPNDASRLLTTEKGGAAATFSVVLRSKPTAAVQFMVTSTTTSEGTVSPAQLDFTESNWNAAQVVTVTGVDDPAKDGNIVYAVRLNAPTTADLDYQKLTSTDVKVVNLDDDLAGITPPKLLSGIDGGTKLITNEGGATATFSISLTSKPQSEVKVPIASSNTAEGKVTPATLTFTTANYATAQVVTVTGQPDSIVDGNQAYTVTVGPSTSEDMNYAGLTQSVKVTNQDDDSAYIVVSPSDYSGTTTEKGGTAIFRVSLHSQPTVAVTLSFVSSKESEGRVAPSSLLFTPSNWSAPQDVTVTGVNDDIADGDVSYTVAVKGTNTTEPNYQYAATTLSLVNKDDDPVGLKVTAAANLQTSEAGGKVTFTVALTSQPTANVNVSVTSSNIKEGTVSSLQPFTASNWSNPQTVTVTGVNDAIADGNQTYTVTLKASGNDAKYAALAASTVTIVNKEDDDAVGIIVDPTSCATSPSSMATFSVVLKSQPLGPVSIALTSDTQSAGTIPVPTTLSFTAGTWNNPQMVTVTGVDEGTPGTMTNYKIVTAPAVSAMDPAYSGLNASDVACVNTMPPAPANP